MSTYLVGRAKTAESKPQSVLSSKRKQVGFLFWPPGFCYTELTIRTDGVASLKLYCHELNDKTTHHSGSLDHESPRITKLYLNLSAATIQPTSAEYPGTIERESNPLEFHDLMVQASRCER
jgi:hypothetical protein